MDKQELIALADEKLLAEAKQCAKDAGWSDEMYLGLMGAAIRTEALRAIASQEGK